MFACCISKLLAGTFDGGDSQENVDNNGNGSDGPGGADQLVGGGGSNVDGGVPAGVDVGGSVGVQGKDANGLKLFIEQYRRTLDETTKKVFGEILIKGSMDDHTRDWSKYMVRG